MNEKLTIDSTECVGFGTTVPTSFIDVREAGRQLMTVTANGEITFTDDLTIDEAKYIIREILKWKMN